MNCRLFVGKSNERDKAMNFLKHFEPRKINLDFTMIQLCGLKFFNVFKSNIKHQFIATHMVFSPFSLECQIISLYHGKCMYKNFRDTCCETLLIPSNFKTTGTCRSYYWIDGDFNSVLLVTLC